MKRKQLLLLTSVLLLAGCDKVPSSLNSESNTTDTTIVDDTIEIKNEINAYLNSIDLENYIGEEKTTLQSMISSLRSLVSTSKDKSQLEAAFSAFKTKYLSLKTKAEYEKDEKTRFDDRKKELLSELTIANETQYRKEELLKVKEIQNSLFSKIEEAETIDELSAIDMSVMKSAISSCKTNAQYTMEEILPYGLDSDWSLVNEHRDQMTLENDGTIKTKDDGYALDSTVYTGDMEIVFSINTDEYCNVGGVLLANKTAQTGHNGLDGYLINVSRTATTEYYQIFYLNNGYCGDGSTSVVEYIGGWVYSDDYPGETVTNNKMRVIIKNGVLSLYKNADYLLASTASKHIDVDLTANNQYELYNNYHFGIMTWLNGGVPFNFELDMLSGNTIVNGVEKAKSIAEKEIGKIDLDNYAASDRSEIEDKILEVRNGADYDGILNLISELKELVASTPSKSVRSAVELVDHIFSDDHSIQSTWDAVQTNMKLWTHTEGTNSVVNPGNAGWQLADDNFTNFRMTVNMSGATPVNPFLYSGYLSRSFLIGAEAAGYNVKGYAITVQKSSTECWVQLHYLDGTSTNTGTAIDAWYGDYDGKDFTIEVIDGVLKFYNADGTAFGTSYFNNTSVTLSNYNGGHIGVFSWTYDEALASAVETTMTFKELKALA